MQIEYEAKFSNIDKNRIRKSLKYIGAKCVKEEILQKRVVFYLPTEMQKEGRYARVRDEGDKVTTSIKMIEGEKIEDQKEICLEVDNFDNAVEYLMILGCKQKAYQENLREKWIYKNVEITLDTWPFLETFIEIESTDEQSVKDVSELLGFDYKKALFGAVDILLERKYNITKDKINNHTPYIVFDMENPWVD